MSRSRARSRSRGYQRAMPFNPLHLGSSLALWLRADSGVTLGGTPLATGTTPPAVTIAATDGSGPYGFLSLRIEITTGGARGTALFRWSTDDGTTWQASSVTTAATVVLAGFNCTISFPVGTYATDNVYRTTVSSWNDQSGNGRHAAQATANKQPICSSVAGPNAKPAITFDGSNDCLQIPSFAWGSAAAEWFSVWKPVTAAAQVHIEYGTSYLAADGISPIATQPTTVDTYHGSVDNESRWSGRVIGTWYTINSAHDRTQNPTEITIHRANGTSIINVTASGNNAGNFGTNTINIGARNGASFPCDASFCEIVACSAILSASDRSRVESYLRAKWAHY